MKVKAIKEGFFGGSRVRVGTVFDIESEKLFSKKWMVKVEGKDMPPPQVAVQPEPENKFRPIKKSKSKASAE